MGYRNPLTGPISVSGGSIDHVDTVDTVSTVDLVTAIVNAVTVAGGIIDTVQEVQTVINAVTAAGGTIDTVQEVQAVIGAVTAAGGTIDSVQTVIDAVTAAGGHVDSVLNPVDATITGGTVDSVTNPVTIEPSTSIATVSSNVPMLGREYFYWPAMSGEDFPPVLSGFTYSQVKDQPSYVGSGAGSLVTFPQVPRRNPVNGGQGVTVTFLIYLTALALADLFKWGPCVFGMSGAGRWMLFSGPSGNEVDSTKPAPSLNVWHSVKMNITSAGIITIYVDDVLQITTTAAQGWPPSLFSSNDVKPSFRAGAPTVHYSQLQFAWQ